MKLYTVNYTESVDHVVAKAKIPFTLRQPVEEPADFFDRAVRDFKLIIMFARRGAIKDIKDKAMSVRIVDLIEQVELLVGNGVAVANFSFPCAEISEIRNAAETVRNECISNLPIHCKNGNYNFMEGETFMACHPSDLRDGAVLNRKRQVQKAARPKLPSIRIGQHAEFRLPKKYKAYAPSDEPSAKPMLIDVPNP